MGLLQKLGTGQGYLKAGFQGFQGAGKTYTAALLACGTYKHFGLSGPIAFFDTEGGSEYVAGMIRQATGSDPVGVKSQAFTDLLDTAREVEKDGIQVFLVDSMTHVWRELCEGHLRSVNQRRRQRNQPPRHNLEFQDWGPIKARFKEWTDWYLNSKVHVVICGRSGYEYDTQTTEDGRKELVKTGTKMKTEGEFGFEPSLLVEMSIEQSLETQGPRLVNVATVLKDRFGRINLQSCVNPTFEFFRPHIELLRPGAHAPIATETRTRTAVEADGSESRLVDRDIFLERIEAALTKVFPAATGRDKAMKLLALDQCFGTSSWTQISRRLPTGELALGTQRVEALMDLAAEAVREGRPLDAIVVGKVAAEAPRSAAA